ncbi:MAG: hypothetical protein ABSF44_08925 [Candidatus Bathyarchaeia archaeon]|jgi:hypothetical protein
MVKLIMPPSYLRKFFNNAMPLKEQTACSIRFTPVNAQINFTFHSDEIAILAKYPQPYFWDYESDNDECFFINHWFLKILSHPRAFKHDEIVSFWTDSDSQHAYIVGEKRGEKFESLLIPAHAEEVQFCKQPIMQEEGLMPTLKGGEVLAFNVHARLTVEKLIKALPMDDGKNDKAGLSWDGKTLELTKTGAGSGIWQTTLQPASFSVQGEPIGVCFDGKILRFLAKQFVGEVWLGIAKNAVVISQDAHMHRVHHYDVEDDFSLTYVLLAEPVDDEL